MLIVITLVVLTAIAVTVELLAVRATERAERESQMRAFDVLGARKLQDAKAKRIYRSNLESVWLD